MTAQARSEELHTYVKTFTNRFEWESHRELQQWINFAVALIAAARLGAEESITTHYVGRVPACGWEPPPNPPSTLGHDCPPIHWFSNG